MKFQAERTLPVGRPDYKFRRFRKVSSSSAQPVAKNRCSPSGVLSNASNSRPSAKSYVAFAIVLLLGLVALLQVGSVLVGGNLAREARIVGIKLSYSIESEWRHLKRLMNGRSLSDYTYEGYKPPYSLSSTKCSLELSEEENLKKSNKSESSKVQVNYDVCLAVSIGDDGDRPVPQALPYPLAARLTEELVKEAASMKTQNKLARDVRVLVGVDYGSIVCNIVRDSFAELPGTKAECVEFTDLRDGTRCGKLVVGTSRRFVAQMPREWHEAVTWKSQRVVDLDCDDPSRAPPSLPEQDWRPTIVTGFSSNHMRVGLLMLRSIGKAVNGADGRAPFNVSVVVWAMEEFDGEHQRLLDCVVDELVHEYGVPTEVRLFNWTAYPSWTRIRQNLGYFGGTGEYAWKAVMVHTVLRERGMVLWGDAGNRFREPAGLFETLRALNSTGFVSRNSKGTVLTRTHRLQLKYFRASVPDVWDVQSCEAAVVGFTLKMYSQMARPWYDCSLTRQCIAPDGSNRSNHRQDQAALTILSIMAKNPCGRGHPSFSHHADVHPEREDNAGTYVTKCYVDPLELGEQGTLETADRPHGIID